MCVFSALNRIAGVPPVASTRPYPLGVFSVLSLIVLSFAHLVSVFLGPVALILSMTGNEKSTLKGHVLSIVVNFVLCTVLIPEFSAMGAAYSFLISVILSKVILSIYVSRKIKINPSLSMIPQKITPLLESCSTSLFDDVII